METISYSNGKTVLKGNPNELAQFIMMQSQIQFNINEIFNQISQNEKDEDDESKEEE